MLVAEDGTFDLTAANTLFDQNLIVITKSFAYGAAELFMVAHLADAYGRAEVRGLDKYGKTEDSLNFGEMNPGLCPPLEN